MRSRLICRILAFLPALICAEGLCEDAKINEGYFILVPVAAGVEPAKAGDAAPQQSALLAELECWKRMKQPVIVRVVPVAGLPAAPPPRETVDWKRLLESTETVNRVALEVIATARGQVDAADAAAKAAQVDEAALKAARAELAKDQAAAKLAFADSLKTADAKEKAILTLLKAELRLEEARQAQQRIEQELKKLSVQRKKSRESAASER